MNTTDQAVRDEVAFARRRFTFHPFQTDYHDSAQAAKDRIARATTEAQFDQLRQMSQANRDAWANTSAAQRESGRA